MTRILLVEDNPVNQEVTLGMLAILGCDADVAENGRKALEATAATRYDLVLMDCMMPVMDGYAATRAIRARERRTGGERIPVVALTADALSGDGDLRLAAGMDGYLGKPFTIRKLQDVLANLLPQMGGGGTDRIFTSEVTGKMEKKGTGSVDRSVLDGIRLLEGPESRGLLVRVLNLYLSDSLKQVERIRSAVKTGDAGSLRRAAHTLKSSSANVGASGLAEICRMVEEIANTGEPPDAADPLPEKLEQEYRSVRRELQELLAAGRGEAADGE